MTKDTFDIDLDAFTLGDIEYLVDTHGEEWMNAVDTSGGMSGKGVKILIDLIWRVLLQTDPNATQDDARKIKLGSISGGEALTEVKESDIEDPQSAVASVAPDSAV